MIKIENKMTKDLVKKINERKEILNLLANQGCGVMVFNYPYESNVNLTKGKNQEPIFNLNEINHYNNKK